MSHKNPFARERLTFMKVAVNLAVAGLFVATWAIFWATNHTDVGEQPSPVATASPAPVTPGSTVTPGPSASATGTPPTATATPTKAGKAS